MRIENINVLFRTDSERSCLSRGTRVVGHASIKQGVLSLNSLDLFKNAKNNLK